MTDVMSCYSAAVISETIPVGVTDVYPQSLHWYARRDIVLTLLKEVGFVDFMYSFFTRIILNVNCKLFQGPGDPVPKYTFELTTNFFDIDGEGYLVVSDENLDRDLPTSGKFRFQVSIQLLPTKYSQQFCDIDCLYPASVLPAD